MQDKPSVHSELANRDIATGVESSQHAAASFIQCVYSVIRRTCEYPPVGGSWPRPYPSIRCESPDPFACLSINCANVCRQRRDENHVVGDCGGSGDRAVGIIWLNDRLVGYRYGVENIVL
jgi:hypothetical protein